MLTDEEQAALRETCRVGWRTVTAGQRILIDGILGFRSAGLSWTNQRNLFELAWQRMKSIESFTRYRSSLSYHFHPSLLQCCVDNECYPSPLNYYGFKKSCCTSVRDWFSLSWVSLISRRSVNEIICHGIPDLRPLQDGDIVNGE